MVRERLQTVSFLRDGGSLARHYPDWIEAFLEYSSYSEAPKRMRFWVAVSTVAGALRRRVWLDMAYFHWSPNFFIILVAPPGIVSKSTTAGVGMNLLRQVPGVKFGPDVTTWQSLVQSLSTSQEEFAVNGHERMIASEITIESSELGNLFNPQDREMVDLLITLWDGRKVFSKTTKMSGSETIANPWINIIACTTPSWIAGNFPEHMVGGGFTSRCIFIYAEEKEKYVAYPSLQVPTSLPETRRMLVQDLERISLLSGAFRLLPSAIEWGNAWYKHHYENRPPALDDDRFGGYIARKQTHLHKLAMVLAAAQSDELTLSAEVLAAANVMISDIELDMPQVFARIGKSEAALQAERLVSHIKGRGGCSYEEAFRFIHSHFPGQKDMEDVVSGAVRAGLLQLKQIGEGKFMLVAPVRGSSGNSAPSSQP